MKLFHSPHSVDHGPVSYFRRGAFIPHPEQPDRYHRLFDAAIAAGLEPIVAADVGMAPILAVHDAGYVEFLASAWARRTELPGEVEEVLGGHFAKPQMHRRPSGLLGQIGYYTADTSTPLRAGSWGAIVGSAHASLAGAEAAWAEGQAYALARPPGHHAFSDCAAGFCFLNNSAIAAERLRSLAGGRVAMLDIDVHHGNGTQQIFYDRDDVLTISVHGHPGNFYPYYAGYEDETGTDAGEGWNLNLTLREGADDAAFTTAIATGVERVVASDATALVIPLGLDAAAEDPLSILQVSTDGFVEAARIIASAKVPTLLVQEGGYLCDALPRNLRAFLESFEANR